MASVIANDFAAAAENGGKSLNNFIWPTESVKEISSSQPDHVPEKYIRDIQERPQLDETDDNAVEGEIPVLDMAAMNDEQTKQQELQRLAKACQEWGFFQIVNHGIPAELMDSILQVSRAFFELPLKEKQRYKPRPGKHLAGGYGQPFVVDENQKLDWCDLLTLSLAPRSNIDFSVWPCSSLPHFEGAVKSYSSHISRVARFLLSALALTLGLHNNYFHSQMLNCGGDSSSGEKRYTDQHQDQEKEEDHDDDTVMLMRMHMYPQCSKPELVLGLTPHADGSCLTLVLQDSNCVGLHVLHHGEWKAVRPVPGALVVNIGDLVEVMSNGRYMSVEHRAVPNKDCGRHSVAVFYSSAMDSAVEPAHELVQQDGAPLYRRFIHKEYVQHYLSGKLNGKHVLHDFAKIATG